jgi:NADP-dependent 3-hydroxy acid dehydrogenase YdfG
MTVCVTARTQESLEALLAGSAWAGRAEGYVLDLADEAAVGGFCGRIGRRHVGMHVLVHAAGAIALGSVADSRLEDFDLQHRVNVRAPYQLTRALLPLILSVQGQVVFINSSAGLAAREQVSQYAATKHALKAVADSLRAEVNPDGIRVLSVYLGRTATRMQSEVHAREGKPYFPERLLQPEDVASVVVNALELPRTAEVTDIHIRPMLKS